MEDGSLGSTDGPRAPVPGAAAWRSTYLVSAMGAVLGLGLAWAWLAPGLRPWIGTLLAAITVWLAHARGFNTWCWLFAGGPIGILVLLMIPPIGPGLAPTEGTERRRRAAGVVGGMVSSVNLISMATLVLAPIR